MAFSKFFVVDIFKGRMSSLVSEVIENYSDFLETNKEVLFLIGLSSNTTISLALYTHDFFLYFIDPIVDSWMFMKSPLPVITILVSYLYFVLKLGPHLMSNRPAFDLKNILIFYNGYQVLFSLWMCGQAVHFNKAVHLFGQSCKTAAPNSELTEMVSTCAWWYFFSKIIELLDTVFFVLRKKQSQVTFLHVYHHGIMLLFSWVYLKFIPGEQGLFIGFLNSFVHVVMYSYYLIAALGPKYQKYLWWKKYMTWLQLTQFCIMLLYLFFIIMMDCKLSKSVTFFFVANIVVFLFLFSDFYRKAYINKKATAMSIKVDSVESKKLA
ncbi:hypothetical protein NQ315_013067 [Exocentrus adspersus]|uniref:Elongation of very long chain fatty acids protein n=1 Tax=Exocentrus adspersus TaxID=1586481 RepID=A0AAV8VXH4_9CUCU|nr:hypothetical protein NQ315_013067 [Exocentrus adspersus]